MFCVFRRSSVGYKGLSHERGTSSPLLRRRYQECFLRVARHLRARGDDVSPSQRASCRTDVRVDAMTRRVGCGVLKTDDIITSRPNFEIQQYEVAWSG